MRRVCRKRSDAHEEKTRKTLATDAKVLLSEALTSHCLQLDALKKGGEATNCYGSQRLHRRAQRSNLGGDKAVRY